MKVKKRRIPLPFKPVRRLKLERSCVDERNFLFYQWDELVIGREPVDAMEVIGTQPAGCFVLVQVDGFTLQGADVAVHREVELRIVPVDGGEEFVDADFGIQFLADFADKRFLRCLSHFNLSARELPPVLPRPVTPLGGKNLVPLPDYCRYHFNGFHFPYFFSSACWR